MRDATRQVREAQAIGQLKTCVWPLCDKAPDRVRQSPLCPDHSFRVYTVEQRRSAELRRHVTTALAKPPPDPVQIARTTGQIYYIRLNDIIKIGFSQHLQGRLQDYTVGAELLAHHQGTLADERDLHRTFKPFLVHGREWYRGDAQILLDHIASVIAEHGPPLLEFTRATQPTGQVAQVRSRTKRNRLGSWAP